MFDDKDIERSQTIAPALIQALRESRISIVVLSKNYASSSLCLDELVEILKCREELGQIVMPIFYGVFASDVRKQTGDFGDGFKITCQRKTEEERQIWSRALTDVSNIVGEELLNWDNEADLIEKIASVVADQLYSIHKPYFARISLGMSSLSVVFSILDLSYKIRDHKARFRCNWPIPWFYYPSRGYNRIFGSFTDTVLLFCVVGGLIVSTINYIFIERRRDGPIKVSIWPLFFAIGMVGSKFMEKPTILKYNSL